MDGLRPCSTVAVLVTTSALAWFGSNDVLHPLPREIACLELKILDSDGFRDAGALVTRDGRGGDAQRDDGQEAGSDMEAPHGVSFALRRQPTEDRLFP